MGKTGGGGGGKKWKVPTLAEGLTEDGGSLRMGVDRTTNLKIQVRSWGTRVGFWVQVLDFRAVDLI